MQPTLVMEIISKTFKIHPLVHLDHIGVHERRNMASLMREATLVTYNCNLFPIFPFSRFSDGYKLVIIAHGFIAKHIASGEFFYRILHGNMRKLFVLRYMNIPVKSVERYLPYQTNASCCIYIKESSKELHN